MVYKLNFPPAFMIKHNTVPKFLLQPSFGVLMNDSFNINISLNFCIKKTHLKNCLKLSIFNKSFQFSIRTCCTCLFMEAFIAWNYFFLINIIMFSCYDSLARPVRVQSFGLHFLDCEACQLCLDILV